VSIFSKLFKKTPKPLLSDGDQQLVKEAIQWAEAKTSGEVRVFMETRCRFVDPIDRAKEIFEGLHMYQTKDRNAVLVYIALDDHQLAVFGDEAIHQKVGYEFWKEEVKKMVENFNGNHIAEGISTVVRDIGDALHHHFPYDEDTDKNELPDEIVFGH
jgi:uncharacterized membrane protein